MSIFKKIKKDIKTDLKAEIRELLHTKDPFTVTRSLNSGNKKVNRITHRSRHRR
jgi:hypothetical protein